MSGQDQNWQAFVQNKIQSNKIMIFGRRTCPHCRKAEDHAHELLRDAKVQTADGRKDAPGVYEFFDREHDEGEMNVDAAAKQAAGGYKFVPMVFVNGEFIGGNSEFEDYLAKGSHKSDLVSALKL